jgi:glutathione S-transferase
MKLRYSPTSPYVRKVMIVAIETGQEKRIEKQPAQVVPTNREHEIAAENPLMKVPALTTDDGMVLYDSPVICEYLDTMHSGAKLFPAAGPARWTALRQQALGDGILDAGILNRYENFLRPENLRWKDWSEGQMAKVRQALAALERDAGQLAGPLTIGQVTVGCALGYLDFRYGDEGWQARHPKLAAWYQDFAKRPSMQQTAPQG